MISLWLSHCIILSLVWLNESSHFFHLIGQRMVDRRVCQRLSLCLTGFIVAVRLDLFKSTVLVKLTLLLDNFLISSKFAAPALTAPFAHTRVNDSFDLSSDVVTQTLVQVGHYRVACFRIEQLALLQHTFSHRELLFSAIFIDLVHRSGECGYWYATFAVWMSINSCLSIVGYST